MNTNRNNNIYSKNSFGLNRDISTTPNTGFNKIYMINKIKIENYE
jgi:hypothetical protein